VAPRPLIHNGLTAHRTAALKSETRMRATNAEMNETIQRTRKVIDDGREVISQVDALLRGNPYVAIIWILGRREPEGPEFA